MKYCNRRYPDSVYFNMLLLIICLSAIKIPICHREMSLILWSTSFGFAQNTIHDFQNTVLNSKWPFSQGLHFLNGKKSTHNQIVIHRVRRFLKTLLDRITKFLRILWEKEKMLVASIFSFFHNVFSSLKSKFHVSSNACFVNCKCFDLGKFLNRTQDLIIVRPICSTSLW